MEAIDIERVGSGSPSKPEGPGRLLTDARLKLGLEPQNVAEMLHLREYQIRALEADDYDNLPEPTYVKGYLRAYCQLLSIDPEKIVRMYSDSVRPPSRESFEGLATEKQAASNDNLVKLVSFAMIALVAGLAIAFWLTSREPSAQTSNVASTESEVVNTNQVPTTVVNEPEQVAPTEMQKTASETAEVKPETKTAIPGANSTNPAKVETQPAQAVTAPKAEPAKPVIEAKPAEVATDVTKPVSAAVPPTSSAGLIKESSLLPATNQGGYSRLLIKTSKESWVDIRDAKGNKLIYETVPAGREIPLEGTAPFNVFLGNANAVQLYLNGKSFDFSSFRRGLTARFEVAKKSGTQ